jgi:2,4-dienoyl-CoA reductase-like NADH-dependent reductase (Old Yellow Enzyme family)/thioredoxin reductase
MTLDHLLGPLDLGHVRLRNRIVSTAHQTTLVADHLPTADMVAYHEARARGGAGMIVIEATAVHPTGRLTGHTLAGYREEIVAGYERIAAAVQPHGTRLFVQLFHGGRELITPSPRPPAVAPSAVPSLRFHAEPRALRAAEIDEIVAGYAHAATLAAAGGLDGVELSAAHRYLLAQFMAPELNLRDDRWAHGTSLLEAVVAAVRDAAPGLAVGVRLTADDPVSPAAAHAIAERVDYLSLALGDSSTYHGSSGIAPPPGPSDRPEIVALTGPYRVGPPLIATTRITDPVVAERAVAAGAADAVGMTRALITDPDLPRKAADGRLGSILRCIGCNVCISHYHAGTPIACGQNPRTGRERTLPRVAEAERPRRLAVVGAGPAGLAAAAELAAAGHRVVVFERDEAVGGQIGLAGAAPAHRELAARLRDNYAWLGEDPRVELRLGVEADAEQVRAVAPDAVVVATGARPYAPALETGGVRTMQAWDVLAARRPPGGRQVVVADWGGGAIGLDAAEVLAADGRAVRFVTAAAAVGETLHQYARNDHLARLYRQDAKVEPHLELAGAEDGTVRFRNVFAPELERAFAADLLVLALGRVPDAWTAEELAGLGVPVEEAGDCLSPRSLEEAILEGTLAARRAVEAAERAPRPAAAPGR